MTQQFIRTRRPDINSVSTMRANYLLDSGQVFYETPKSYEIWIEEPLRFVHRIPKSRAVWVVLK